MSFLTDVASSAGINFLVTLAKGANGSVTPIHKTTKFNDEQQLSAASAYVADRGVDQYFALGTFKKNIDNRYDRKAVNCTHLRSLWLDIDAGEEKRKKHGNKVYLSVDQAIEQLQAYLVASGTPMPTYIVMSGTGLHVYWCLTSDVGISEWRVLAGKLKSSTMKYELKVDHGRTVDAASILRVPNTMHSSTGNMVEILHAGEKYTYSTLLSALGNTDIEDLLNKAPVFDMFEQLPSFAGEGMKSNVTPAHAPKSFGKIIALERDESSGCAQLSSIYLKQNEVSEPLWRAGLSIANFCDDRAEWIHKISNQYDNYAPDETEAKASACRGPYTCNTFDALNPGVCANCPHRARGITSPIVLGLNPENVPVRVSVVDPTTNISHTRVVPTYPFPFYRKETGGIWVKVRDKYAPPEMPVMVEKCVWPYDLYISNRVADVNAQQYWCVHHSPKDGIKEFVLESEDVASGGEALFKVLFGMGVPVQPDMRTHMSRFIQASVMQRVETVKAREVVRNMGWTNDETFVLGDNEYTHNGTVPAPVSSTHIAARFAKGTRMRVPEAYADNPLAGWRELLSDAYPNGYESALAGQYIVCAAMGAPIASRFSLDDQRSGLINIYSDGTGHGKTMATAMACRVFGEPDALTVSGKKGATVNAFFELLGYASDIPLVRDEITLLSTEDVSDMAYELVGCKTKVRMDGQRNDIREGERHWGTYVFSTSNRSIVDTLVSKIGDPTAQYSRVTEFEYPLPEWLQGDEGRARATQIARRADGFSGIAGSILIDWCVKNYETAKDLYESTYDMLAGMIKAPRNKARFWLNHATGVAVGALVGEMLGLHSFDSNAVIMYAVKKLDEMWMRSSRSAVTVDNELAGLLNSSIDQWLVINKDSAPITTVHRDVKVRVEESTMTMWITTSAITEYCAARGRNASTLIAYITQLGGVSKLKRMLSNTPFAAGGVPQRAWEIPMDTHEFRQLGIGDGDVDSG